MFNEETCDVCNGTGYIKYNKMSCTHCEGSKCIKCKFLGVKKMPYDTCNNCFGTGKTDYTKQLNMTCCINSQNK